ncbi:type I-B CRISPR-associated protein Cas5b [Anaerostipes sp.]|uniref:type I-B CRISPR-associated protein Cas5b n=1 Tax=Anaerostipes sp. TaxID=1872530 RepID=UPI0025BEF02F|nr:type I-B CRISPR-associated protein Cas5b [Anaerostipes sp.]MBS7006813.1 type I-B CRISPR-associated protein Cas5 [Anaerostipes sp.]
MKFLIFDISGKFAHFRRYETNSSSLSYSVPPRTTIYGLIASVMGFERDSYYEMFTPERAKIGVQILSKNRKVLQTLNYLKILSKGDFRRPEVHTQIPFEVLTNEKEVRYRIYFWNEDKEFMEEMERRLDQGQFFYTPYMGTAPFQCMLCKKEADTELLESIKEPIEICTVTKINEIIEDSVDFFSKPLLLSREKMPRYFNHERYLQETESYLMETGGQCINMQVTNEVLKVTYSDKTEYVTFL